MRPSSARFAEVLRFRVPGGVRASLADLAEWRGLVVPDLLRRMVRSELEAAVSEGVDGSGLIWEPHGQPLPMDSTRRMLPPELAAGIRTGLRASGMSLRQAAEIIGIDNSYLCRLTQGTRMPSHHVAARLVNRLPIDLDTADALLDLTREHEGV